jgi:hypothetical protein
MLLDYTDLCHQILCHLTDDMALCYWIRCYWKAQKNHTCQYVIEIQ